MLITALFPSKGGVGLSSYPPYRGSLHLLFPFVIKLLFCFSICHVGIWVSLLRHMRKVAYMI